VSQTDLVVVHLDGVAEPGLLREVSRRLEGIRTDAILESGYIEECLEDHPTSWFPQIEHTERPDKVAGALLEGRVAILTDNTPFALLLPSVFAYFLQTPEDYYERPIFATAVRWVRALGFTIAGSREWAPGGGQPRPGPDQRLGPGGYPGTSGCLLPIRYDRHDHRGGHPVTLLSIGRHGPVDEFA